MAQYIKQGDIFGRIGTGVGKGIAEQLPEEIQRGRLASGLRAFERDAPNLSPLQQISRSFSIPGTTPEMQRQLGEFARQQARGQAYRRSAGLQGQEGGQFPPGTPQADSAENLGQPGGIEPISPRSGRKTPTVSPTERQPQIVNEPELADRTLTRPPWTPQQRDSRIIHYMDQGFLSDQARDLASDDEARDLASPSAYQKRLDELKTKSDQAKEEFKNQLETKLQKTGEGVYKDITGEMLVNMQRGLERDLRANPNASFKDVANSWSNKALQVAKAKSQFDKLAQTTGIESFFTGDKNINKLNSYAKIFREAGNSEEYYNILRKRTSDGGLGLSPQGAASVAFEISKNVENFIDNYSPSNMKRTSLGMIPHPEKISDNARKAAIDIEKFLDSDDSILAIAKSLSQKDRDFDQRAFFEQLIEDQDRIRLNDRQKREISEGERDILPTWADIKYLPWSRRSRK